MEGDVFGKIRGGAGIGGVFGGGGGGGGCDGVGCSGKMAGGAAEMFDAVLSEGERCRANTLSLVSSVGVRGGGAVRGESGRLVGEAREECREVWCSVWWLGEWVRVGAGES